MEWQTSQENRNLLLETAGRLKRRGLDQSVGQDISFPNENSESLEFRNSVIEDFAYLKASSKAKVWLKISDFTWIGGVIDSEDERF